ncbi:hypothetical protein DFR50_12648 [Roseiarcus fermentans]|uniref:Uncharacterized protein n=1 Tax=Roseiarcus fermentans TaxID=1473586 RepID=A0A366F0L9_9HYPH|nr:hypothetical protein [Roseiarcus fermentans]RBP08203.1 hypothetical protein DFR50_12648 [Roseiarcus fermentans]
MAIQESGTPTPAARKSSASADGSADGSWIAASPFGLLAMTAASPFGLLAMTAASPFGRVAMPDDEGAVARGHTL